RECSGLIYGPRRCDQIHDLGSSAICPDGQPSADDLAQGREVGLDAVKFLSAAASETETGHHFIEDQKYPFFVTDISKRREKIAIGRNASHIPAHRFDKDGGDLSSISFDQFCDRREIVISRR